MDFEYFTFELPYAMHAIPPRRRQPTGKDGRLKEEETNQQDRQTDGQRGGTRNAPPLWAATLLTRHSINAAQSDR